MSEYDEQQAADALATVERHQEQTRRAARVPVRFYAVMFVLIAAAGAVNDFITLTGAKVLAVLVMVVLVAVVVTRFVTGKAPLDMARGVERRRPFNPRVYSAVVIVGVALVVLIATYGTGLVERITDAIGPGHYPNTIVGVLFAIVLTGLYALYQVLMNHADRRS
jgi:hypothetical protein